MKQITIQKMKLPDQLIKNLNELGFEEIKPNLYCKQMSENTFLFRDYRGKVPCSYAYFREKRINSYRFKETQVIEKIEAALLEQNPDRLTTY